MTADPDLDANDIAGIRVLYGASPVSTTQLAAAGSPAKAASSSANPALSTLIFHLSEDAWHGDAPCYISVDGHQLGVLQTVPPRMRSACRMS